MHIILSCLIIMVIIDHLRYSLVKYRSSHMYLGRPLLTISYIKSVRDLHPFFHTVATLAQSGESLLPTNKSDRAERNIPKSVSMPEFRQVDNTSFMNKHKLYRAKTAQLEIEQIIEWDFLEPLPKKK